MIATNRLRALLCAGALAAALAQPSMAQAAPASHFDTDAEGWTVQDLLPPYTEPGISLTVSWQDGHIGLTDPSEGNFYFEAPAAFLGDLSAYYGGSLHYEQTLNTPQGEAWRTDADVMIYGAGLILFYQGSANPSSDWTAYDVTLSEAGWHVGSFDSPTLATQAQFRSVLADLTHLRIRGEYIAGVFETTTLDNVRISAVPEADQWLLLLAGLGLLALAATRRRD